MWARTVVSPRQCSAPMHGSQRTTCLRQSLSSRISSRGGILSNYAGSPDLLDRSSTTMTRCSSRSLPASPTAWRGGAMAISCCCHRGDPPQYEFMVVVDAEDRKEKSLPLVRMMARIEPEWLIDLFPNRVREKSEVIWNRVAERVEAVNALLYDELVIQESKGALPEAEAAAALLAEKALETGIDRFVDIDALNEFLARLEFAGFQPPDVEQALRELCVRLRSFAELKSAGAEFLPRLEQELASQRLNEIAPASIRLRNGRQAKVNYERGKPPWIASRLQDFLGMRETPRIGRKATPVVVHLLAPNQRPVQTTTDLAGFWERLYPQVRRELMRRYPKHLWPERP